MWPSSRNFTFQKFCFFLWGHIKAQITHVPTQSLEGMKTWISRFSVKFMFCFSNIHVVFVKFTFVREIHVVLSPGNIWCFREIHVFSWISWNWWLPQSYDFFKEAVLDLWPKQYYIPKEERPRVLPIRGIRITSSRATSRWAKRQNVKPLLRLNIAATKVLVIYSKKEHRICAQH